MDGLDGAAGAPLLACVMGLGPLLLAVDDEVNELVT